MSKTLTLVLDNEGDEQVQREFNLDDSFEHDWNGIIASMQTKLEMQEEESKKPLPF